MVKPPHIGARNGAPNNTKPNAVMDLPLAVFKNISDKDDGVATAPAAPIKPQKNRHIMSVWISFAVAVANEKHKKPKEEAKNTGFRPYTSERGPHTTGPPAKPKIYNEVLKTETVWPTPNTFDIVAILGEVIAEPT